MEIRVCIGQGVGWKYETACWCSASVSPFRSEAIILGDYSERGKVSLAHLFVLQVFSLRWRAIPVNPLFWSITVS